MCGHRALLGPTLPTKREMEFSPVPRVLKAAFETAPEPAAGALAHSSVPAPTSSAGAASASTRVAGAGTGAPLGELAQDVLDALAAFLHPLDLARLGLCSRGLLRDAEASAALLLRRQGALAALPHHPKEAAAAAAGASHRYRYLCTFEVAAAGGEKLKAALRCIYEDSADTAAEPVAAGLSSSAHGGAQINLSGAQVGDEGVEHLALALRVSKAHRVRILNLSRCDISDQGARSLLLALKDHAEVDTLCLGQNRIGSPGAQCIAQFLASSPPRLRSLSISDNPITDEGAHNIVGALPACASLATLSMRCKGVSSQVREEVRMTWGGRGGDSVFGLYI